MIELTTHRRNFHATRRYSYVIYCPQRMELDYTEVRVSLRILCALFTMVEFSTDKESTSSFLLDLTEIECENDKDETIQACRSSSVTLTVLSYLPMSVDYLSLLLWWWWCSKVNTERVK